MARVGAIVPLPVRSGILAFPFLFDEVEPEAWRWDAGTPTPWVPRCVACRIRIEKNGQNRCADCKESFTGHGLASSGPAPSIRSALNPKVEPSALLWKYGEPRLPLVWRGPDGLPLRAPPPPAPSPAGSVSVRFVRLGERQAVTAIVQAVAREWAKGLLRPASYGRVLATRYLERPSSWWSEDAPPAFESEFRELASSILALDVVMANVVRAVEAEDMQSSEIGVASAIKYARARAADRVKDWFAAKGRNGEGLAWDRRRFVELEKVFDENTEPLPDSPRRRRKGSTLWMRAPADSPGGRWPFLASQRVLRIAEHVDHTRHEVHAIRITAPFEVESFLEAVRDHCARRFRREFGVDHRNVFGESWEREILSRAVHGSAGLRGGRRLRPRQAVVAFIDRVPWRGLCEAPGQLRVQVMTWLVLLAEADAVLTRHPRPYELHADATTTVEEYYLTAYAAVQEALKPTRVGVDVATVIERVDLQSGKVHAREIRVRRGDRRLPFEHVVALPGALDERRPDLEALEDELRRDLEAGKGKSGT